MKKTRMSIDDIHAMVGSIRANVLNMRVTNIYDLQDAGKPKTYILKLHQPPFPKVFLLLESGVRFHTSKYARASAASSTALPSQFTMKLRKHLRGKRLTALAQLEGDRVVDLTFGSGAAQCHLVLELYAAGNIVLTDESYTVLSLLRTHKFDESVKLAVKQPYPIQVLDGGANTANGIKGSGHGHVRSVEELEAFARAWFEAQKITQDVSGKASKKKQVSLKQLLLVKESSFGGLGPVIVEHCLVRAELVPTLKIKTLEDLLALGYEALSRLVDELQAGWTLLSRLQTEQHAVGASATEEGVANDDSDGEDQGEDVTTAAAVVASADSIDHVNKCGFIILKDRVNDHDVVQFEEFTPYLYAQHRVGNRQVQSFATFDEAVDEYFSHFEAQQAQVARQQAQVAAESKLAKLRTNQKQHIDQLLDAQETNWRHAQLVETNQQDVENVLLVIRSALASGMDWRGLEELVRYEQKNGNPVASLIHELDLAHNRVSVLLCDGDEDEDEEEDEDEGDKDASQLDKQAHVVWIDLSLSALANAREIYAKKKKAGEKVKKATQATDRAIQLAEKSTKKSLEKQQMKRNTIYQRRKTLWFEKFHWFLSNEKYLVIAGKDAQQNELLVKRYLRKGDVYVHADLHGAATCVVRNRGGSDSNNRFPPIPIGTLEQASCMSVCRSHAWSNQVIAGAFWVNADQVSKTAPTGEYLSTGSFMIRGKKNFIQPSRLEMGLAIVFRVDASSVANHADVDEDEGIEEGGESSAVEGDATVTVEGDEVEEEEQETGGDEVVENEAVEKQEVDDVKEEEAEEEQRDAEVDVPEEQVEDDDAVEEQAVAPVIPEREGKKRLSAKQRRDLKKGRDLNATPPPNTTPRTEPKKTPTVESTDSKSASMKNVRGKKGKLKKMKAKYADQDDEDRQLRMEALGHAVPTAAEENDEDTREDDADGSATGAAASGDQPVKDEAYIRLQREKKEKYLDEEEEEIVDFFDAFVGAPTANDIVLFAMPMCAPYASLTKYTYKVKLLPGVQKKGKAAKAAMEYFLSSNLRQEKDNAKLQAERATTDEDSTALTPDVDPVVVQRELMKCIPENELINCMVGPVKISAPGLHGAAALGKKNAKGGKKPNKK